MKGFPKKDSSVEEPPFEVNAPVATGSVKGDFGLELEVEGTYLPNGTQVGGIQSPELGRRWIVHEDGSLRNGGREYVVDAPINLTEVPYMVQELFAKFKEIGTLPSWSNRTSTHVHVNVNGLKANVLTSFMALWTVFEEAVVNWCGETRVANHFCLRAKDSDYLVKTWSKSLRNGEFRFSNDYKYMALNVGSFNNFGSFEFRSLRGAENPQLVVVWVHYLNALREEAKTTFFNPETIAEHISMFGPDGLFRNICEKYDLRDFFNEVMDNPLNGEFNKMGWNGFRMIQDCIHQLDWHSLMEKINSPHIPNPFGGSAKKKSKRVSSSTRDDTGEAEATLETVIDELLNRPVRAGDRVTINTASSRWDPPSTWTTTITSDGTVPAPVPPPTPARDWPPYQPVFADSPGELRINVSSDAVPNTWSRVERMYPSLEAMPVDDRIATDKPLGWKMQTGYRLYSAEWVNSDKTRKDWRPVAIYSSATGERIS